MYNLSNKELDEIRLQMLKFAVLQLSDSNLAEDIVQEAFESAYKYADTFCGKSALKTWIFSILKNKIIDALKRKKPIPVSELVEDHEIENFFDQTGHWSENDAPSEWTGIQATVYKSEFWAIFHLCLNKLPAQQARVFMMRNYLGLATQEICQECEISVSNLNVLLYRARLQLQVCLARNWFNGENDAM
ncbi:sigma-70 family RNA polymerase sigma factor [Rodentibacter myodis]|uniref:RNA polymerase subunit sigma n=1 Tax=Rodentibacter myodis TaxID=1907939 RepID=A0A1V3JP73_9PAST|nr:sigma-70 family RNA polymerase sigma factor [Rodentibacter myodis]OOF58616.1 RNA polymerase subunit sigma [Rodentibacter myodis]